MSGRIHPSAVIDPSAQIAENVTIGPGAVIEADVSIGEGCRIDAYASVKQYTSMGKNNRIHSYAMVGGEPQDLKFSGEVSRLELGDNNTVREFATLHRGTESGGALTSVGNHCLLMAYTHVAHDCHLGDGVIMSNNATLAGHVQVGSNAIISGLSAVHQFVRIGRHAFVGGMSGVGQDIPPFLLATETRALLRGPNLVGLRRMSASSELINALKNTYRLIWRSDMPRQEALEKAEQEYAGFAEVRELPEFVRASTRGVTPAFRETEES